MFKLQGDFAPRSRLTACCWDPVLSRTVWLTPPLTLVPVRSLHRLALSSTLFISLISPLTLVHCWTPALSHAVWLSRAHPVESMHRLAPSSALLIS